MVLRTVQDFDATDTSRVALWPLQLIVDSVPTEDPRFTPRPTEPLAVRFPHQSSVVSVDQNVYSVVDTRTGTAQDAHRCRSATEGNGVTSIVRDKFSWGVAGAPTGRCYYGCTGRVVAVDERTGVLTVSFDHLTLDPPHLQLGDVIAAQYYEHKGYLSLKEVATRLRSPIWVVSCVGATSKFAPAGRRAFLNEIANVFCAHLQLTSSLLIRPNEGRGGGTPKPVNIGLGIKFDAKAQKVCNNLTPCDSGGQALKRSLCRRRFSVWQTGSRLFGLL